MCLCVRDSMNRNTCGLSVLLIFLVFFRCRSDMTVHFKSAAAVETETSIYLFCSAFNCYLIYMKFSRGNLTVVFFLYYS